MNNEKPSLPEFLASLRYTAVRGTRRVGVEREFFLYHEGRPDPNAQEFLLRVGTHTEHGAAWTYELSACQIEHRTEPHKDLGDLRKDLVEGSNDANAIAGYMNREVRGIEVAPESMTLATYPDPRYAKIAESLGEDRLRAACRVAGVHVHVECFSLDDAIRVYGALRHELPRLVRLGDHSGGQRMRLYGVVVNGLHIPPSVENAEHLYERACNGGWGIDHRSCWWAIRFSRHGTIEVRVFGSVDNIDEVVNYARQTLAVVQ